MMFDESVNIISSKHHDRSGIIDSIIGYCVVGFGVAVSTVPMFALFISTSYLSLLDFFLVLIPIAILCTGLIGLLCHISMVMIWKIQMPRNLRATMISGFLVFDGSLLVVSSFLLLSYLRIPPISFIFEFLIWLPAFVAFLFLGVLTHEVTKRAFAIQSNDMKHKPQQQRFEEPV